MYDILFVAGGKIGANIKTRVRDTYKYVAILADFVRQVCAVITSFVS